MKKILSITILLTSFSLFDCSTSQQLTSGSQTKHSLKKEILKEVSLNYLLYLPEDYNSAKKFPLMLFLHGAGERGEDIQKVKVHGPPKLIEQGKDFPLIIVSPQCPDGQWWSIPELDALLDEITFNYNVDIDRIYVTGLSMGGYGTWELAIKYPYRFAAIAPICGGGNPRLVNVLKDLPVWAFHGAKDMVVPLKSGEEMVEAPEKTGGKVKFTVYPEATHDSWTMTYDNPELYKWFLEQKRIQ